MLLSHFLLQTHTTSHPICQVFLIRGIAHTVNLLVLFAAKYQSLIPLIEKWEEFRLPKISFFLHLRKKDFLFSSRVAVAMENFGGFYLRSEFRIDTPSLLEGLTSTFLLIVEARSDFGQRLSCFCPEILIGG